VDAAIRMRMRMWRTFNIMNVPVTENDENFEDEVRGDGDKGTERNIYL
jgi:hypothetical protein